jgi:hypothetical protein
VQRGASGPVSEFPHQPNLFLACGFLAAVILAALPAPVAGQSAAPPPATLEFTVLATPTGGRAEKVMRHPFYLLRASVEEIEKAARTQATPPGLDAFIDDLKVSPELRAWMKRTRTVALTGYEFISQVTPDDILEVPEFRHAYVTRNLIMVGLGFPKRKAKLTDKEKNPAKWEESEKRYWDEVRAYATLHPESKQGMDEHLLEITSGTDWNLRLERHEQEVRQRFLQILHRDYLAAQTETDYEGRARFTGLPAGRYWLTNLYQTVRAGDVQLRWELLVELRPGQSHYLELSNANALLPSSR